MESTLKAFVRDVPDFPKPGIVFKDITPLLLDPAAFAQAVDGMAAPFRACTPIGKRNLSQITRTGEIDSA